MERIEGPNKAAKEKERKKNGKGNLILHFQAQKEQQFLRQS